MGALGTDFVTRASRRTDRWAARSRRQAHRLDNCMAGVGAVLGTTAFCLLIAPAIVAACTGSPS